MISILGIQRVALLIGLLVLNLIGFGLAHFFIGPSASALERSVSVNRSEGSRIQAEIESLQDQFVQLDTQQVVFNTLKERDFFEPQGRRDAEKILREVQERSGVFSAKVGISAASVKPNEIAQRASHSVLKSPVNITVQAFDDLNIFQYIYILRENFPGYLSIDKFSLSRPRDVDANFLRDITLQEGAAPLQASLEMTWSTMVPDDVAGVDNSLNGGPY